MSNKDVKDTLAIMGGVPVRQKPWPNWPRADAGTERNLLDVLHSGRWAISGMHNGKKLYERQFAEAFAAYHGLPYCVPTANGSSALAVALEALGVGPGDEVLVPGVTWVACASSVAAIGAIPILVDIEPDTLCMSVEAARQAITPRTAAIMLVHLYCTVADLDAFVMLSDETGIPLLEDCSQAHGAMWKGRRVGTFGKIGAFSMQDSKVLTCGEGGATITRDRLLYDRMQELRADGRRYAASPPPVGQAELEDVGSIQGRNMCLSEFHAAILLDRLQHLDEENRWREQNAEYLRTLLADIGGVTPLSRHPAIDALTYYQFCVRLDLPAFGNADIEAIRLALVSELDLHVETIDTPLNDNTLYTPLRSTRLKGAGTPLVEQLDPKRFSLPNGEKAERECLTLPHKVLLGERADMEDIAAAFAKVKARHGDLAQVGQAAPAQQVGAQS